LRNAIAIRRAVLTGKLYGININENGNNAALVPRAYNRASTSNVVNEIA
jgi:hypothetical protein